MLYRVCKTLLLVLLLGPLLVQPAFSFAPLLTSSSSIIVNEANKVLNKLYASAKEMVMLDDLRSVIEKGPVLASDREFLINGWRWHTACVLRDVKRFLVVLQHIQAEHQQGGSSSSSSSSSSGSGGAEIFAAIPSSTSAATTSASMSSQQQTRNAQRLLHCCDYLCGFNWKALMRVESELFFPWLQGLLPSSANSLITDSLTQHQLIRALSAKLEAQCNKLVQQANASSKLSTSKSSSSSSSSSSSRSISGIGSIFGGGEEDASSSSSSSSSSLSAQHYRHIEELLLELQQCAERNKAIQDAIFVPYISAFVGKKDQEVFNRKVISRLGIINSQTHLVGMYDTIKGEPKELEKFRQQIPKMLQRMLPVLRKRLYLPKAECLEKP